jgi:hypothetical protein
VNNNINIQMNKQKKKTLTKLVALFSADFRWSSRRCSNGDQKEEEEEKRNGRQLRKTPKEIEAEAVAENAPNAEEEVRGQPLEC